MLLNVITGNTGKEKESRFNGCAFVVVTDYNEEMLTVLITGANRGLGLEFVRQYLATGWRVHATCRNIDDAVELKMLRGQFKHLHLHELELTDFSQIDKLAKNLSQHPLDLLINNAGIFGPKPIAEKDFRQKFTHLDYQIWSDLFTVNTMVPVKMSEAFIENIRSGDEKKIVTISSIVGSIADGEKGLIGYPSSKAAVNMAMATLAHELREENIIVNAVNPGWVKTDMGGNSAPLEIIDSIQQLRALFENLSLEQSGLFLDYDGNIIPW